MKNENATARPAPRFAVGDWAYNNGAGHNAKVVGVYWDKSLHGYQGGWRYSVPGLSSPDLYAEKAGAPYVEYEQVSGNCWRQVWEKPQLVAAVKAHAAANYKDGWDYIVECWSDAEIAEEIGDAATPKAAIEAMKPSVEAYLLTQENKPMAGWDY